MKILKTEANYLKLSNLWYDIAYCDFGMYFCQQNAVRFVPFIDLFCYICIQYSKHSWHCTSKNITVESECNMCNQNEKEYKKCFWSQVCLTVLQNLTASLINFSVKMLARQVQLKYSRNVYPGISKYTFNCTENLQCNIVSTFAD